MNVLTLNINNMAKKQTVPTITIADCVRELELINHSVFSLKQGLNQLIAIIEKDNLPRLKEVVEVFGLKEHLAYLTAKN